MATGAPRSSRLTRFRIHARVVSSRLSPEHNSGDKDNAPQQQRESKIPLRPKRSLRFGHLPYINSLNNAPHSDSLLYINVCEFGASWRCGRAIGQRMRGCGAAESNTQLLPLSCRLPIPSYSHTRPLRKQRWAVVAVFLSFFLAARRPTSPFFNRTVTCK